MRLFGVFAFLVAAIVIVAVRQCVGVMFVGRQQYSFGKVLDKNE